MFKYFFACPKSELVESGKLVLDALGEAAVALRDCRLEKSQCEASDTQASSLLGAGTVIDPFPGDRSPPPVVFGATRENHAHWKWLAFEPGQKLQARGVQALIGYDPTVDFDPALLRRRRMIDGDAVSSGSASWLVPIARSPAMAYGRLSTRLAPASGGKWERRLDQKDSEIWALSGEVQDFWIWQTGGRIESRQQWTDPWSINTALKILGINYRVGRPEVLVLDELGVNPFNSLFLTEVLHAFLGYSEWEAWYAELQKKRSQAMSPAPADSKSGSGEREGVSADLAAAN